MSSRHTFRAPGPASLLLLEQSFLLICNLVDLPQPAAPSSFSEQKPFDELIAFARMPLPLPMPSPCLCLPNHNINFHVWLLCPATIHTYLWLMLCLGWTNWLVDLLLYYSSKNLLLCLRLGAQSDAKQNNFNMRPGRIPFFWIDLQFASNVWW